MKIFLKILKWLSITIGAILLLLIGTGIYITYNYEEIVKKIIVTELNKYIDSTEINVGNINFSLIKKFPHASVEFVDIYAKFPKKFNKSSFKLKDDTLFRAKSLFFQFNIVDIFKNNYKINQIEIKEGKAIVLIDKKGNDNYHFWKEQKPDSANSNFKLELNKVQLIDMTFRFLNLAKNIELKAHTNKLEVHGDFSADTYSMSTLGNIVLDKFVLDNVNYTNSGNATLKLDFDVNNNSYVINKGEIKVANLKFALSGKYITSEPNKIDLKIKGEDIDIESFLSLLPEKFKKNIDDYSSKGNFYFNTTISGDISRLITPHIEVKFGISNGNIDKNKSAIKLYNVNVEGIYSNGAKNTLESSTLKLNKFSARLGKSSFEGKYSVISFSKPKIELIADAELNLEEIQEFIRIDTIKSISGNIKANVKFTGNVQAIDNFTKEDFQNATTEGKISITNGNIIFIKSNNTFKNINGLCSFRNNDIMVDSAAMNINKNDIAMRGYLKNIVSYIMLENEKFYAEANIRSSNLNINELFPDDKNESKHSSSNGFATDQSYKINLFAKHLIYDKINANNVKCFIDYNNKLFIIQNLSFEAMEGNVKANGSIKELENKKYIMSWDADVDKVNIKKLFNTFDNFGQSFITEEHLRGIIKANAYFTSEFSNDFDINYDKLVANGKVEITNGELVNFKPMMGLSDYISVKELKHIKFSKLKNDIYIKDQKITIPQMTINTSAINLDLSGEHLFDGNYTYHIKVLLSDVLAKKARKAKTENEEFGVEEDDGSGKTNLFLTIKGNADDFKVTYDAKTAKKNIKQEFIKEKENLKTILNKEFGLFKKDSAVIRNIKKEKEEPKKKKSNFTIEWDNDTITK